MPMGEGIKKSSLKGKSTKYWPGWVKLITDYPKSSVGFESGTRCWFHQNTAPHGWTIDSSVSDSLIACKGGAVYTTGGLHYGTWTQPSHTHNVTVNNHTHSVPVSSHTHNVSVANHSHAGADHYHGLSNHYHSTADTILTVNQIPPHAHGIAAKYGYYGQQGLSAEVLAATPGASTTDPAGAGLPHNHSNTGIPNSTTSDYTSHTRSSGVGVTGGGGSATVTSTTGSADVTSVAGGGQTVAAVSAATADTWRPAAATGVICIKS
jgi:hypothetical protein